MNKLTLIIDGNWLLMSRFASMKSLFEIDGDNSRAREMLVDKMAQSINIVVNQFDVIDNVVLVTDGGSWRKTLERPECIKSVDYKGTRVKDNEINWTAVYGALTDLAERCRVSGMTAVNAPSVEGDDWIAVFSKRLLAEGTSSIIWSTDMDLTQLLGHNETAFIAQYNEKNMYYDAGFRDTEGIDFFMASPQERMRDDLKGLVNKSCYSLKYINPDAVVVSKIIVGDKSDNIVSVARKFCPNMTYGVTDLMFEPIKEKLNIKTADDLLSKTDEVANEIVKLKKFTDCDADDVVECIKYNAGMVRLGESYLPVEIKAVIDAEEIVQFDLNEFRDNYKVILETESDALSTMRELGI